MQGSLARLNHHHGACQHHDHGGTDINVNHHYDASNHKLHVHIHIGAFDHDAGVDDIIVHLAGVEYDLHRRGHDPAASDNHGCGDDDCPCDRSGDLNDCPEYRAAHDAANDEFDQHDGPDDYFAVYYVAPGFVYLVNLPGDNDGESDDDRCRHHHHCVGEHHHYSCPEYYTRPDDDGPAVRVERAEYQYLWPAVVWTRPEYDRELAARLAAYRPPADDGS